LADHGRGPAYHNQGQPDRRTESLDSHIAWDLGGNVERKQYRQSIVVLDAFQVKVLFEMVESGVPDVGSVQKA
jgi:hypothetical protein